MGEKQFYSAHWSNKHKFRWTLDEVQSMAPPGWGGIIKDLCQKLFYLGWDGGILQVKEKFGTLRFYQSGNFESPLASDIASDVIAQAESMSGQVCEACGEYGRLRGDGWVRTLCMKHAIEQEFPLESWEKDAKAQATEASTI